MVRQGDYKFKSILGNFTIQQDTVSKNIDIDKDRDTDIIDIDIDISTYLCISICIGWRCVFL